MTMELKKLSQTLEDIKRVRDDGTEYWCARELYGLLGYETWRSFQRVVERAKESCQKSENDVDYHFVGADKMVDIGSGSQREVYDVELTRYACYLIAQNGDPRISEIAFAQMYFAIQTRKQELLEKDIEEIERIIAREKLRRTEGEFARTIYERGVDGKGIAEIRNAGDYTLFGGKNTRQMKSKLGIKDKKRPLADFLHTVVIKAKDLATEITTFKTEKKDLQGVSPIKGEHVKSSANVRKALTDNDIFPEELSAGEDVEKVKKRIAGPKREEIDKFFN